MIHKLKNSQGSNFPAVPLTEEYVKAYLSGGNLPYYDERYIRFSEPVTGAFAVLVSLGISLADIQLIWDFQTASEDSILSKMKNLKSITIEKTRYFIVCLFILYVFKFLTSLSY